MPLSTSQCIRVAESSSCHDEVVSRGGTERLGGVLDEREVTERFVRSTGPGGQNLNRDATAVELRLDIGRSSLPRDVQARLIALAGRHITTGGVLVVVGRAHRSQAENRDAARARLVALLKRAAKPP